MTNTRRDLLWAFLGLAGVYAFIHQSGQAIAGTTVPVQNDSSSGLDDIYKKYASQYGLDWRLLKAMAMVESGENPQAINPSDPSYGLMQIVCTGAAGDQHCTNNFNILGWDRSSPNALLDPDYNVSLAAQILDWNIATYGLWQGVAVYNNWSARNDPIDGPYRNQGYVDKVRAAYQGVGGIL